MNRTHDDAAIRRVVLAGMGGFFAVALVALAVLLRAYREPEAAAVPAGSPRGPVREIRVTAGEFAFDPAEIVVAPGETVRFVVTNTGQVQHEFRVDTQSNIDAHIAEGHVPAAHGDAATEANGPVPILVAPGETATLEWTFGGRPGSPDRIACLLPGHYEAGMKGAVTVR